MESKATERQSYDWDLRNAPRNYLTLVVSQLGIGLLSFASIWIATRILEADGFGKLSAMLLVSQLIQISIMWTGTALSRYGVQEFVENGDIRSTFWARTLILIPNWLAVVLLSPIWLPIFGYWFELPTHFFGVIVAHLSGLALSMHVQFSLQAAKLPRFQSYLLLIERVLTLLILSGLVLSNSASVGNTVLAYALPLYFSSAIGLFRLFPFLKGKIVVKRERILQILKFSLPLPVYSLLSHFSFSHLDAFFIVRYLSISDLGVYSLAYQMNGMLMQMPALAGSLLMPLFVTAQKTDRSDQIQENYFRSVVPVLTLLTGLCCTGIAFAALFFIPLLFSFEFKEVASLMWVFAAATTISVPVAVGLLPIANTNSMTTAQMFAAFGAAVVNVGMNLLLIPRYGLLGCAWATVCAFSASMLIFSLLVGRKRGLPITMSILSVIPSLVGAAWHAWSGNAIVSILLMLVSLTVIVACRREPFVEGVRRLLAFRGPITQN
jgi:O-antigen/teichoic acid export membrane protein